MRGMSWGLICHNQPVHTKPDPHTHIPNCTFTYILQHWLRLMWLCTAAMWFACQVNIQEFCFVAYQKKAEYTWNSLIIPSNTEQQQKVGH